MMRDSDECFACDGYGHEVKERKPCHFCEEEVEYRTGEFRCYDCGHEWYGKREGHSPLMWDGKPICGGCKNEKVGSCVLCSKETIACNASLEANKIICGDCQNTPVEVWCPDCNENFSKSGYLRVAFAGDPEGFQAACLVTHYRHEHVKSHDAAWRNGRYASKIPGYDYDNHKAMVNNRAKRQLIRAIVRLVQSENYPSDAPCKPEELIAAFGRLKQKEDATDTLIADSLSRLSGNPPPKRKRKAKAATPSKSICEEPLRFGKHKGALIRDVPSDYLEWIIQEQASNKRFRAAVETELAKRQTTQETSEETIEKPKEEK